MKAETAVKVGAGALALGVLLYAGYEAYRGLSKLGSFLKNPLPSVSKTINETINNAYTYNEQKYSEYTSSISNLTQTPLVKGKSGYSAPPGETSFPAPVNPYFVNTKTGTLTTFKTGGLLGPGTGFYDPYTGSLSVQNQYGTWNVGE